MRYVADHALRLREIAPRVSDVAGAGRQVATLDRFSEDLADRVGNLVPARREARRDVEDLPVRSLCPARTYRRIDDVADIGEVARLLAIAVDLDRVSGVDRGYEAWDDGGVLRER